VAAPEIHHQHRYVPLPRERSNSTGTNCKLVYNLPFCSDVAYAVPANSTSTVTDLVNFYDSNAQSLYGTFNNSIQQVSCNTTNSAQYSLVSSCTDCADSYKTWLCAVTIPRCVDLAAPVLSGTAVIPRAMANATAAQLQQAGVNATSARRSWANSSRNALIDQSLGPGPYKELLPCANLCYDLARTCPTVMGFACPKQPALLARAYGVFSKQLASTGTWTCNFLGQDPDMPIPSGAGRARAWGSLVLGALLLHLAFV
jgi:calcium channel MID1